MNEEEGRRDEIRTRAAEMSYAVSHLEGPSDRRTRYIRREIEDLIEEAAGNAAAWQSVLESLESIRRRLP